VKRTTLTTPKRASDLAYEQMLERILDLRLPSGAVINEHAVAAELDLSRMPVHEAVGRLAADRFVTVLPRRGSVVTTFGVDEVLDLFEAREAVECGLAYIAARRANAEDLAELRRLVLAAEQAREGSDHMAFLRDDHEIHSLLVHMVPNPLRVRLPAEHMPQSRGDQPGRQDPRGHLVQQRLEEMVIGPLHERHFRVRVGQRPGHG
jgi:DNA-binding GntR family transcriptional regulator